MKNIKKVFLLMLFVPFCMSAQTKRYYCEIKGTERELSSKMKIIFDFGQNSSYNIWSNLNHKMEFVDNEGKVIDFNSMVDAMNYMSERGWKFLQAYSTITVQLLNTGFFIKMQTAKKRQEKVY